jgi:hypothetical protein
MHDRAEIVLAIRDRAESADRYRKYAENPVLLSQG